MGERFHHRRPQQGRAHSPSGGTLVRDPRNGEAVEPHVKISPVAPLSWPGEVVDGALWLLTCVPRKTTLRNLGGEPDKVIETLLDAFEQLHATDEEKEGAIHFLNVHDKAPDKMLAEAIQKGFQVGERVAPPGATSGRGLPPKPEAWGGLPQVANQPGGHQLAAPRGGGRAAVGTHKH